MFDVKFSIKIHYLIKHHLTIFLSYNIRKETATRLQITIKLGFIPDKKYDSAQNPGQGTGYVVGFGDDRHLTMGACDVHGIG